jgi:hypothetical protein
MRFGGEIDGISDKVMKKGLRRIGRLVERAKFLCEQGCHLLPSWVRRVGPVLRKYWRDLALIVWLLFLIFPVGVLVKGVFACLQGLALVVFRQGRYDPYMGALMIVLGLCFFTLS